MEPIVTVSTQTQIEEVIGLLALALVVAVVARLLRFPYTLALALVGLTLGALALLPNVGLRPDVILFIFLPILLFEGAWNIEVSSLLANWFLIFLLAVPGLLIAVGIGAVALHFGAGEAWLIALLLSAIISPTDPIAVIALLRQLGMSGRLRTIIEGESLFNDGVGAATFTITLAVLLFTLEPGFSGITPIETETVLLNGAWLFAGGILFGGVIGGLATLVLRGIEDRLIETTLTFIVAYGAYILADLAHASGILAVVVAGLILGSYGRRIGISDEAHDVVDTVWEFLAYGATSVLFLLLGVQIGHTSLLAAAPAILCATLGVFAGRAVIVFGFTGLNNAVARLLEMWRGGEPTRARGRPIVLPSSWKPLILLSGLRGALSIALALSLPSSLPNVQEIQSAVYGVVLITLLGQGITIRFLLPRWPGAKEAQQQKLGEPLPASAEE